MTSNLKKTAYLLLAVFLLSLDRFLKSLALFGFERKIFTQFFSFRFAANHFIAFSLPLTGLLLNVFIFSVVIALLSYFVINFKQKSPIWTFVFALIILGAASNLYDRLVLGYVVDYFDMAYFTVFNLADVMISSGVAVYLLCEAKSDSLKA